MEDYDKKPVDEILVNTANAQAQPASECRWQEPASRTQLRYAR
jgi:hypothetical protein